MSTFSEWLKGLPDTVKVFTAAGGLVSIGFTAAVFWFGAKIEATAQGTDIARDSVQVNARAIQANALRAEEVDGRYETIICLLTLPEDTPPLEAQGECP